MISWHGQARNYCGLEEQISEEAMSAVETAHKAREYKLDIMVNNEVSPAQYFIILGEAHVKTKKASAIGIEFLKHFPLRGLEGVPQAEYQAAPALLRLSVKIREPFKRLTGLKSSTIGDGMDGFFFRSNDGVSSFSYKRIPLSITSKDVTEQIAFKDLLTEIEETYKNQKGNKKLTINKNYTVLCGEKELLLSDLAGDYKALIQCFENSEYPTPFATNIEMGDLFKLKKFAYMGPKYILGLRNERMAKNLVAMLNSKKSDYPLISVMGLAHNPGIMKLIQEQSNFKKCEK
jgi:hypothetical protein